MNTKKTSRTAIQVYREVETITVPATQVASTPVRKRSSQVALRPARKRAMTDFLLEISSAASVHGSPDEFTIEGRYSASATQVNSDLALAAFYEAEEDITMDTIDSGFFDMVHSPEFERLRARFIEEATMDRGRCYALHAAIWRGYVAGRICPERFVPRTKKQRERDPSLQREALAAIKRNRSLAPPSSSQPS